MPNLRHTKRKILQTNLNPKTPTPFLFQPFLLRFLRSKTLYPATTRFKVVNFLGCWKWFNGVLKEADVTITDDNKGEIDNVIHKYIGEQSSYGRCSADWKKARKQINESPEMRQELIQKLKALT